MVGVVATVMNQSGNSEEDRKCASNLKPRLITSIRLTYAEHFKPSAIESMINLVQRRLRIE